MADAVARAVAIAAAVGLGLSAGAMLTEGAILVPFWRSLPPAEFLAWYARHADALFDFFGPLEIAGAGLAIAAAIVERILRLPGAALLVVAAILAVAVLVPFPIYFEDVNASFAAGTIEHGALAAELGRWAAWHRLRTGIGIGAFVVALLALARR